MLAVIVIISPSINKIFVVANQSHIGKYLIPCWNRLLSEREGNYMYFEEKAETSSYFLGLPIL